MIEYPDIHSAEADLLIEQAFEATGKSRWTKEDEEIILEAAIILQARRNATEIRPT